MTKKRAEVEKEITKYLEATEQIETVKKGCFGLLYTESKTCEVCLDKDECKNIMSTFSIEDIEKEVVKIQQEIGVQIDLDVKAEAEIEKYVPEIQEEVKKVEETEKKGRVSKTNSELLEQYPELIKLFEENKEFTPKRLEITLQIINLRLTTTEEVGIFVKNFLGEGKSEATIKTYVNVVLNMLRKAGYITVEKRNIIWSA